jgi:hypothetical protein
MIGLTLPLSGRQGAWGGAAEDDGGLSTRGAGWKGANRQLAISNEED